MKNHNNTVPEDVHPNQFKHYLAHMKKSTTLLPALVIYLYTFTGCKVYYTTSDVNTNLKSTVDQVNSTLASLNKQVAEMEKEYRSIPCEKKSDAFHAADRMLLDLDSDMQSLEQLHQTVNNDYKAFAQYTQGKSKIESGTEEWSKLKVTKQSMKTNLEELQNRGNETVAQAEKFNAFVNASVIPTVQLCEVKSYTTQFEKAVAGLAQNLQTAQSDLKKYDADIARITGMYGSTHASTCNQLSDLSKKIHSEISAMDPIHRNTQRILNDFKTKTKGLERIYSCNSNWHLVSDTESAIHKQEQDFNTHKLSITSAANTIQQLVTSLQK
jgi:hypothetical protein